MSKGKLPVIINTQELYYQSLDTLPDMLRSAFKRSVEVIDRDVQHHWSEIELRTLLYKLERWHVHEKKALLIKGSTWHSLNSARKSTSYQAVVQENATAQEESRLLTKVLDYLKVHGVRIEDECHSTSDPHQETVRGFELGKLVPYEHHKIYYKAYLIANSVTAPGSTPTDEERQTIIEKCVRYFVSYKPFLGLSWLESYLLSPINAQQPNELVELNKKEPERADLVVLAKASIHYHMPHTSKLTLGKEYGTSLHTNDLTAAPRHEGRATLAHYLDSMLVSALTVQMTLEAGVPLHALDLVIKSLRDWHNSSLFKTQRATYIETKLRQVLACPDFVMDKVTDKELYEQLVASKALTNPWLIKRYLKQHALKEIRLPGRSAKSTPAEMALGFSLSIQMSATPGPKELYYADTQQDSRLASAEFVAEVVTVLMARNSGSVMLQERTSPKAFFKELAEKSPQDFIRLRAILDIGGIFANWAPEYLIKAAQEVAAEKNLARHGISWHDERTIRTLSPITSDEPIPTIAGFSLQQTTGRDYKELDPKAHGILLLGKKVTLSSIVQAAMRERKLLQPGQQTLFWALFKDLWHNGDFTVEKALRWAIKIEAEAFRSKIVTRAFQAIDAELQAVLWSRVATTIGNQNKKTIVSLLCPEPKTRAWDLYTPKTNCTALEYLMQQLNRLALTLDDLTMAAKSRLKHVIDQTPLKSRDFEVLQQIGFQQKEQNEVLLRNLQKQNRGNIERAAKEEYTLKDCLESFTTMDAQYQPLQIGSIKLPQVHLADAIRLSPRTDWSRVIKPLSHILIRQLDNEEDTILCPNRGSSTLLRQKHTAPKPAKRAHHKCPRRHNRRPCT